MPFDDGFNLTFIGLGKADRVPGLVYLDRAARLQQIFAEDLQHFLSRKMKRYHDLPFLNDLFTLCLGLGCGRHFWKQGFRGFGQRLQSTFFMFYQQRNQFSSLQLRK